MELINSSDINVNDYIIIDHKKKIVEEEPWDGNIEKLMIKWKIHATNLSELHERAGYSIKFKHNVFGLIPVFIPLIMTYVSQVIDENGNSEKINGVMFLISGIFGAVYKWLNLGEQYTLHFQYAARYDDIITSIDAELSRNKRFRRAADAFTTEIRGKIDNLNQTSPDFSTCYYNLNCHVKKNKINNNDIVITIN